MGVKGIIRNPTGKGGFKPGQSGNPNGRGKGVRNVSTPPPHVSSACS